MLYFLLPLLSLAGFVIGPIVAVGVVVFAWFSSHRSPLMLTGLALFTLIALGAQDSLTHPDILWAFAGAATFLCVCQPGALRPYIQTLFTLTLAATLLSALVAFEFSLSPFYLSSLYSLSLMGSILICWKLVIETSPVKSIFLGVPTLVGVLLGYWGGHPVYLMPIALATILLLFTPNRFSALMGLIAGTIGFVTGMLLGTPVTLPNSLIDPVARNAIGLGLGALAILAVWRIRHHGWQTRYWGWTTLLFLAISLPYLSGPALVFAGALGGVLVASVPYDMTPLSADPILNALREKKVLPETLDKTHPPKDDMPTQTDTKDTAQDILTETERKAPPLLKTGHTSPAVSSTRKDPPLSQHSTHDSSLLPNTEKQPT